MSTPPIEWDSEDRISLHKFLTETRAGQRIFPALAFHVPDLLGDGKKNALLIRMGEVRGAQAIIGVLSSLAVGEPKPQTEEESYPSLTDDAAWNDGQKVGQ